MTRTGMLINYEYCTGCHSCELACQMEHGLPADQFGIKVSPIGPWEYAEDKWQYDYVPAPTDQCDLCAERTNLGKVPTCQQHCQSKVLTVGPLNQLAELAEAKPKQVLYVLR